MTEAEWLASADPAEMLAYLTRCPVSDAVPAAYPPSQRKLRLFACGCTRLAWPLLTDPRSRKAVEVAERYADGVAAAGEAELAYSEADAAWSRVQGHDLWLDAAYCARPKMSAEVYSGFSGDVRPAAQAALLRCLAGNPWRSAGDWSPEPNFAREHGLKRLPPKWLRPLLTPTVRALATAAYATGRAVCRACGGALADFPGTGGAWLTCAACRTTKGRGDPAVLQDGLLDPDRLAVLADALEDAGCEEAALLGHLRGPGPHARGCHAIDILLGRD